MISVAQVFCAGYRWLYVPFLFQKLRCSQGTNLGMVCDRCRSVRPVLPLKVWLGYEVNIVAVPPRPVPVAHLAHLHLELVPRFPPMHCYVDGHL